MFKTRELNKKDKILIKIIFPMLIFSIFIMLYVCILLKY